MFLVTRFKPLDTTLSARSHGLRVRPGEAVVGTAGYAQVVVGPGVRVGWFYHSSAAHPSDSSGEAPSKTW